MGGSEELQKTILIDSMVYAVPLWIDRLADKPRARREEAAMSWAADAADAVASHAAALLPHGEGGESAYVFNALARGLAALAHWPGGGQFLGVLWCAEHAPLGRCALSWEAVCLRCTNEGKTGGPPGVREFRVALRSVERYWAGVNQ